MKKRIRNKIVARFHLLDGLLDHYFYTGGLRKNREEILFLRRLIQYFRRRYPTLYHKAFDTDLNIGHFHSGR